MLALLRERRSIRKFQQRAVEPEKIELLTEGLLRAPTSRNLQPCQFVVVDNPQLIAELSRSKAHGTGFLQTAPLAVVIVADPARSDVWTEDSAIAAIILQLVAEDLGLKSCWGQLRLRPHNEDQSASDYVKQLLDIPAGLEVPIVIGIGYPDEEKAGHSRESLPFEKVHLNRYSP
ncbi:MAG: NAD(P)H-dependent dehydrogenase/reductase [Desulfuromonas sp.]|nr:MAG: NAD(P)H-dependent dehydrogenase/reductase [Desulfuromonas sp.]